MSDLHRVYSRELFAEIEHGEKVEQIALGTEDENEGRLRAAEIQAEVLREGWERVCLARSREVTVAVFWQSNPMTCTYTTLLSLPVIGRGGLGASEVNSNPRGWRVLVVEPDGPVRRALVHWLGQGLGTQKVAGYSSPDAIPADAEWDLVLANRSLPPTAFRRWDASEANPDSAVRVLGHGLFADSDAIFASVSGVSRGYFLQRRLPARLLDPLLGAFPEGPARTRHEEDRQIRRHFQNAFESMETSAEHSGPELSLRETQVLELLGRGLADKEIAHELGISVWTVHSHLKRIFGKYGVRTRTEAVVRHLQK